MKFNNTNVFISPNARIGKNVKIGDYSIIYDNVIIDDNTIIANHCVIGEPLYEYYIKDNYVNPSTYIGKNSLIRSHTIIYAGSTFGDYLTTGHRTTIRENTTTGHHCSFGSYTDIQGYAKIGNYNRYHSFVNIGQKSVIGDFVFIYPFVVLTNDPTPPSDELIGATIGDYTQILTASIILPGTFLGKHCLVAANSVVSGKYDDNSFIHGHPAKYMGQLSKMPFFNTKGKKHYPWPYNFDRGMPWQGMDYDEWLKTQER